MLVPGWCVSGCPEPPARVCLMVERSEWACRLRDGPDKPSRWPSAAERWWWVRALDAALALATISGGSLRCLRFRSWLMPMHSLLSEILTGSRPPSVPERRAGCRTMRWS